MGRSDRGRRKVLDMLAFDGWGWVLEVGMWCLRVRCGDERKRWVVG